MKKKTVALISLLAMLTTIAYATPKKYKVTGIPFINSVEVEVEEVTATIPVPPTPPAPIPTPVPTPVPVPPTTAVRSRFAPTSFYNRKLADNAPLSNQGFVTELVNQSKPKSAGGTAVYYPSINAKDYTTSVYIVTDKNIPKLPVTIVQNGAELTWSLLNTRTKAGIRIPGQLAGNPGGDGHIAIWDQVDDVYYEFWQFKNVNGKYQASWGGFIDDVSNSDGIVKPLKGADGHIEKIGATATSLPLMGGCMYYAELEKGVIPHTIGMATAWTANSWVWPAQRTDSGVTYISGPNAFGAGQRFRFPKDIVIDPNWVPIVKMMVVAIRDYGLVVQDTTGGNSVGMYIENATQYGTKYDANKYFGGKQPWEFMQQFPWNKLQALDPSA